MDMGSDWMRKISRKMRISMEPLPGIPLLEVSGNERVLIENHKGIVHYGKDKISVKVKFGTIIICGRDLEIIYMTADRVVFCGEVITISFEKGVRNDT